MVNGLVSVIDYSHAEPEIVHGNHISLVEYKWINSCTTPLIRYSTSQVVPDYKLPAFFKKAKTNNLDNVLLYFRGGKGIILREVDPRLITDIHNFEVLLWYSPPLRKLMPPSDLEIISLARINSKRLGEASFENPVRIVH